MWLSVIRALLASLLLLVIVSASAQQPVLMSSAVPPANPGFVLRRTVDEIHLTFTVTDRQRRPVLGLERGQIELRDEQRPVDSITDFRSDRGLPLQLAVVIDTSGSVEKSFATEQRLALDFVRRVLRPEKDRAVVAAFGSNFGVLEDAAPDAAAIERFIAQLHAGGATALYDALLKSYEQLALGPERQARRAILLLSDGEDNNSFHALPDAIAEAQRTDTAIYAIGLRRRSRGGDDILRELARATGGRAFLIAKPEQLGSAFEEIEQELRSQYMVTFRPGPGQRDGRLHRLVVQVRGASDLNVRARAGYWAPREAGR